MRTAVITGATTGLGLHTATRLAADGWHIVLGHRGEARGQAAADQIRRRAPQASVELLEIDLADLRSVAAAVDTLRHTAGRPELGAVVGNGGIQVIDGVRRSADGYELTFATNHLGHHLLITGLLDHLTAGSRIVLVSSGTHLGPDRAMGFPAPVWTGARSLADAEAADPSPTAGRIRYATSKLANLYLTYELARRLDGRRITANAYDPGLMPDTGLSRNYPPLARLAYRAAAPIITTFVRQAHTSRASARHLAALVTDPRLSDTTATYFEGPRPAKSSPESYDTTRAGELWEQSEQLIGEALARPQRRSSHM